MQIRFGTNTECWVSGLKPNSVRYQKRTFSKAAGSGIGITSVGPEFHQAWKTLQYSAANDQAQVFVTTSLIVMLVGILSFNYRF